jgi:DNA-binding XRE family transcriptional regulator
MKLTPQQARAARALLGWSQSDLAGHVGVSAKTVWVFEVGKPRPSALNLDLVRAALESAGVEFFAIGGDLGVRLGKGGEMTITPEQVMAARKLLGWSAFKLAVHAGVSEEAIMAFEACDPFAPPLNLDLLRSALESAGVIFVEENGEGSGVRLKKVR